MQEEYLPQGRETSGITDIPNGEAFYMHQIKMYTTTDMTADEIHQLGLDEVERISAEMEKVKEEIGFQGDLKAFFEHVRNNRQLMPFQTADQVVAHFEEIHEKMKPNIDKYFDRTPETDFEVRRTEEFRENSASAEYNPGSLDGTRPGIFYVPVPDAANYNIYSDESLFLHEAIPGHHYQVSLTQENDDCRNSERLCGTAVMARAGPCIQNPLGRSWACIQILISTSELWGQRCTGL
jgi:uncharacterized protein (DUF885 family)